MKIKKLGVFLATLFVTILGHSADATYDPAAGTVTIPEVAVNGKVVFVNVKLQAESDGRFSILSTEVPKASPSTATYDPTTGTVTIPSVVVNDKAEYANVKLTFNPDGSLKVLAAEKEPVTAEKNPATAGKDPVTDLSCSEYAAGSDYCAVGRFPTCQPDQSQVNKLQSEMPYNEAVEIMGCHGVLVSRGMTPGDSNYVAVFAWGTAESVVASVIFYNNFVHSFSGD
jgi:hypothetical protein